MRGGPRCNLGGPVQNGYKAKIGGDGFQPQRVFAGILDPQSNLEGRTLAIDALKL